MGKEAEIADLNGKPDLSGKFITGNIIDKDFPEIKGFVDVSRKPLTPKQWQKRRQEILKKKLP